MGFKYVNLFFGYIKKNLKNLLLMFALTGLNQVCYLYLPVLMSDLIDSGVKGRFPGGFSCQTVYIFRVGGLMLLVTLFSVFITIAINRIMAKVSCDISCSLRGDLYRKVMSFSYLDASRFSVSSLMTRLTSDAENVKTFMMMATQLVVPPMMLFGGIIMSVKVYPRLTWVIIFGALAAAAIAFSCLKIVTSKSKIMQKMQDNFNLTVKERLSGVFVTRCFGRCAFQQQRFEEVNSKFAGVSFFISKVTAVMSPLLSLCANLLAVLVLWMSSVGVAEGRLKVGQVVAMMQYTLMIVGAFIMISMMVSTCPRLFVSVKRVGEILGLKVKQRENLKSLGENFRAEIEFKNVGFSFPGREVKVLGGVTFTAGWGEKIGVVGSVGSGKSTLLKLILGFYEACEGEILFGGENAKNFEKSSLFEAMSYASGGGSIFSGTVRENLILGKQDFTEEECIKALEVADLKEFANPSGLNYSLLQQGGNLSGGQRQRLAIARAVLKKCSVYLFDDVFSGLDFKTEALVRKRIFEKLKGKTVFLVSQRVGTVKEADKIIVMDSGKIVAVGNHEELLKNCDLYKKMVRLQFGGEMGFEK